MIGAAAPIVIAAEGRWCARAECAAEPIARTAAECRGYNRAVARVGMTGLGRPGRVVWLGEVFVRGKGQRGGALANHAKPFDRLVRNLVDFVPFEARGAKSSGDRVENEAVARESTPRLVPNSDGRAKSSDGRARNSVRQAESSAVRVQSEDGWIRSFVGRGKSSGRRVPDSGRGVNSRDGWGSDLPRRTFGADGASPSREHARVKLLAASCFALERLGGFGAAAFAVPGSLRMAFNGGQGWRFFYQDGGL